MRLSRKQADGSESDSSDSNDDDTEPPIAEDGLCNEAQLVAALSKTEQKEYHERRVEEEQAGCTTVPSGVTKVHAFSPPHPHPSTSLSRCSRPLDFFHALLPLFFDFTVDR